MIISQPLNPECAVSNPVLGEMLYCHHDETWVGEYNGFEYRIATDENDHPDKTLINFCVDMLCDKHQIQAWLAECKRGKIGCHGGCFDDEIKHLQVLNFMFYRHFDDLRILTQLAISEEDEIRLWRIEFHHGNWLGLDFDY